ncbi:MAG: peptidase C45 [Armatimonadetes bacterium]|nr:peptidase C45 [Armatimonadota bacterium]
MSGTSLPFLRLTGGPGEIGEGHGRAAPDLVAHNLDLYFRRFAGEVSLSRDEVLRRTERYWPAVCARAPAFAEMVEGVAHGAGQPTMEVAALNLRFELFYGEFSRLGTLELGGMPAPTRECTIFALTPEASDDGHLWVGENWDWIPGVAGVLQHITHPDGLQVLCFTEAGIAGGKIGLNSAGIGLAVSGLISADDDWTRMGTPFHARTWEVLCSKAMDAAVGAVTRGVRACSANYLVARAGQQGEGIAVDIETAPRGTCTLEPVNGILVHANHFRDPERLGIWQPITEEWRSTFHRCARAERLLSGAAARGQISAGTMMTILQDHEGHPESVCRHPNPALPEAERYQTGVSILMDLHTGCMQVAAGPPCTFPYSSYCV